MADLLSSHSVVEWKEAPPSLLPVERVHRPAMQWMLLIINKVDNFMKWMGAKAELFDL